MLSQQIGIFGKSIKDIKADLNTKQGLLYSLFGKGLSTKDTSALKQYVSELQKGVSVSQAANATLGGTSAAAKNVAKQMGQLTLDVRAGRITTEQYNVKMAEMQQQMTVTSVKAQMLGGVLRTALNVGLTLLITTLISLPSIIKNITEQIKQQRQEAADSAKQQIDDVNELRTQYYELSEQVKTDSSVKDQLTSVTKQLIKKLGLEKDVVEDLADDYDRLNSKINEATLSSLKEAEGNLRAVLADSVSIETKNDFTPYGQGDYRVLDKFAKRVIETSSSLKEYRDIIGDISKEFEGSAIDFQDSMITFDVSNLDAMKKSYKDVTDLLLYINEEYGDNAQQLTLYRSLASIQIELQSSIDKYNTSLSNLNDNIAQQVILNGLVGREIPKTTEDFEKFKQELIDSIYYTNEEGKVVTKFAGITQDNMELAEKAILSFLETMPEFKGFFNVDNNTNNGFKSLKSTLSGLNSELETLKETTDAAFSNQSTLQSAFDKIQKGSSLSADEVRKLVEIYPEIATEFKKTVDGYTISSNTLIKANDNIIQSTKESVETQIKGYQEVIDQYNEIKNVASMPESARQERLKALGITEDEIKNAEQQINQLRLILSMLGITLGEDASQVEKLKEKYEELSKTGSTLSSKMKSLSSAFKEQKENGELSADTILSIIENGYAAALMYDKETGKVKLNEQAYLNLAKAELTAYEADLQTQISNAELQLLDAKRSIVSNLGWSYLDTAEAALKLAEAEATINNNPELIENLKAQLLAVQELRDGLGSVVAGEYGGSGSGSSTDLLKDAFQKRQKELEHLLNMEQITEAEYYKRLFDSKEYKDLLSDREKYADELNSIDEKFYKFQQTKYKEDADKQFDALDEQFKAGKISAEAYAKALNDLGQSLYGEGTLYAGTETATKELESLDKKVKELTDDIYSERYEALEKANDKTIKGEKNFVHEWSKLANETYRVSDPKKWAEEYSKIADYTQNYYKDLLDKGLLNPEQYRQKITDFFNKLQSMGVDLGANWLADALGKLSESDYLDAWDLQNNYDSSDSKKNYQLRAERVKYIYDLAEQLYGKNGQNNVKAYNELIKQGLEEEKSIWEDRVNDEKTFWEQQKQNVEDSYDTEIDKLKEVQDEEKKLKDLEEKRLAVIKARQKLEDAKKQKNQLIFEGGTFKYDVNQDDILSAEEELANAIEALRDEELNTQIEILEEQKNAAVDFYEQIIKKIDEYLDKEDKILNSDTEVLDTVLATDTDIDTSKSNFDAKKFIENGFTPESFINAFKGAIFSKEAIANMIESFKATRIGTVPANTTTSTATNNSSTTNNANKVINVGGIKVELSLAVQSLEDFVENKIGDAMDLLGKAIEQKMPEIWAKA